MRFVFRIFSIKVLVLGLMFTLQATMPASAQTTQQLIQLSEDQVRVGLKNLLPVPLSFQFRLKPEFRKQLKLRRRVLVPPESSIDDVLIIPRSMIKDTAELSIKDFVITVRGRLGDAKACRIDKGHVYELPFPRGKSYRVIQSFKGVFSHREDPSSKYAIDFAMPVGDTVTAARGGVVAFFEQHYTEAGGREMRGKVNRIFIAHNDGTFGFYVHLDHQGVLVEIGQRVEAGEPIALSGHTGFSSQPHLHFAVVTPGDRSVRFRFRGYENLPQLERGSVCKRK